MSQDEARKLLGQIKRSVKNLSDLIRRAWEQEAWAAAGYANWESCCQAEFPELQVTYQQRLRVVGELAESGMSDRAIAVALNVSQSTVGRTRKKLSGDANESPDNSKVRGQDGKQYGREYVPADQTRRLVNELRDAGIRVKEIAAESGVDYQTAQKVGSGSQKTISTVDAETIEAFYVNRIGADSLNDDAERIADVVPIQTKTGPQLNAARAEARHTLVNAAITMQKAARQISSVQAKYLPFGQDDNELDQAPQIIADAIKTISQAMKGIKP